MSKITKEEFLKAKHAEHLAGELVTLRSDIRSILNEVGSYSSALIEDLETTLEQRIAYWECELDKKRTIMNMESEIKAVRKKYEVALENLETSTHYDRRTLFHDGGGETDNELALSFIAKAHLEMQPQILERARELCRKELEPTQTEPYSKGSGEQFTVLENPNIKEILSIKPDMSLGEWCAQLPTDHPVNVQRRHVIRVFDQMADIALGSVPYKDIHSAIWCLKSE